MERRFSPISHVLRCYKLREIERFVLPHASLRMPLPAALHGAGPGKRWQQRTPAMAARLTDHVWSLSEVLRSRVPSWPQPQVG
jgi:hypothetical protein